MEELRLFVYINQLRDYINLKLKTMEEKREEQQEKKEPITQKMIVTVMMTKEMELKTTNYTAIPCWSPGYGDYNDYEINTDFSKEAKEQIVLPKEVTLKDLEADGWSVEDVSAY